MWRSGSLFIKLEEADVCLILDRSSPAEREKLKIQGKGA